MTRNLNLKLGLLAALAGSVFLISASEAQARHHRRGGDCCECSNNCGCSTQDNCGCNSGTTNSGDHSQDHSQGHGSSEYRENRNDQTPPAPRTESERSQTSVEVRKGTS